MSQYTDPFTRPSTGWSAPVHRYDRHRVAVHAKLATLSGPVVVSHLSAAVLYRLPLPSVVLTVVHVTRPERRAARRSPVLHTHGALLSAAEIVEIDGLPVTSPARTVADCAALLPFAAAVELADAALARGVVTEAELNAEADRPRVPGINRIRSVVAWADPGSRTATDSRHRLLFAGLVAEPPGAHVLLPVGPDGSMFCADVWLPAEQVVGVVDDGPDLQAPPCAAPRLTADRCRSADQRFLRWSRSDLDHPEVVERRLAELVTGFPDGPADQPTRSVGPG